MKSYEIGTGEYEKQLHQFYQSKEWKALRSRVLENHENVCVVCGSIHSLRVDHIKPIRHFWEMRMLYENLQILCDECNKEKGSKKYWTLEEHKRYKKVTEINKAITKLKDRKNFILNNLSEEWKDYGPVIPKPKQEVLSENGKKVYRIRT